MKAYLRHQFEFMGVATPQRRQCTKPYFDTHRHEYVDWAFVNELWHAPYRELLYVAVDYLKHQQQYLQASDLLPLSNLAQQYAWWDSIDGLAMVIGNLVHRHPAHKRTMHEWSLHDDKWLRRIAIIHQLLQKQHTDVPLLCQIIINNLNQNEFFINKAIGWALRDYAKTNPNWVRDFLAEHDHQLSPLSRKEASKYL